MTELFAEVNDIKICYEINGEGAPVILLHGFAMYKEFWLPQIGELSKYFKLITIDFRGCGKSTHPIEPYKIIDVLEDLKGLLDYLNVEKAHMIGHSYGGMIAQNFALKFPELYLCQFAPGCNCANNLKCCHCFHRGKALCEYPSLSVV